MCPPCIPRGKIEGKQRKKKRKETNAMAAVTSTIMQTVRLDPTPSIVSSVELCTLTPALPELAPAPAPAPWTSISSPPPDASPLPSPNAEDLRKDAVPIPANPTLNLDKGNELSRAAEGVDGGTSAFDVLMEAEIDALNGQDGVASLCGASPQPSSQKGPPSPREVQGGVNGGVRPVANDERSTEGSKRRDDEGEEADILRRQWEEEDADEQAAWGAKGTDRDALQVEPELSKEEVVWLLERQYELALSQVRDGFPFE